MLKHMLTQTGSHPSSGDSSRTPAIANIVGIPGLEEMPGSPMLESRSRGIRGMTTSRTNSPTSSNRPVSIHGNVIHNQSIYANTVPLNKLHNTSSSVPNGRISSMNGNLNLSNLNSSNSASPGTANSNNTRTTNMDSSSHSAHDLNLTQISPIARSNLVGSARFHKNKNNASVYSSANMSGYNHNSTLAANTQANGGLNITNGISKKLNTSLIPANVSKFMLKTKEAGVREMITSLALLCLVSLLLALLSLVLLLKISPASPDQVVKMRQSVLLSEDDMLLMYQVTWALVALTLCLNLCCLLVCAIQFLFAVKLVKATHGRSRTTKYLKEAAITRICAISGFFISIPVFLTGIILYTFLHFDSPAAIITSFVIGFGIVFCGAAVVHNVFVWQKEKMSSRHGGHLPMIQVPMDDLDRTTKSNNLGLPQATLDLSATNASAKGLELSTLV